MTQLRSLGPPGTEDKQEELAQKIQELDKELEKLGIEEYQLTLTKTKSIQSYFVCESEEQLHQLHEHYESGLMKDVLERICSLLNGEQVDIGQVQWATEDYQKCQQQFSAFTSKSPYQHLTEFVYSDADLPYAVALTLAILVNSQSFVFMG